MEAPGSTLPRKGRRSNCFWLSGAALLLVILIVVIVPTTVILTENSHKIKYSASVLIPLYIYPSSGAWDPLYDAVKNYPKLNFTVIINPSDGPGTGDNPGSDYVSAIEELKSYANVRLMGYIYTDYTERNISTVLQDVAIYSGWAENTTSFAMDGIFFDETPHVYTAAAAAYLKTINDAVKDASGIQSNRTVIHNPGTPPDGGLENNKTDISVVFEDAYSTFKSEQKSLAALPEGRTKCAYAVHSVPTDTSLSTLVSQMRVDAAHLFVTNSGSDYYESFGTDWTSFVKAMP